MGRTGRSALIDTLRRTPLFSGLSQRQLDALAKAGFERHFEPGEALVRQADEGMQMIAVLEGTARVERDGKAIGTVGRGDVVGEMSLIDGQACSATVVAEGPIDAFVLYRTAFRKLLDGVPGITTKLLVAQTARVRELDRRVAAI